MYRWANQICADDDQERGIVLASMKYVPTFFSSIPLLIPNSMWNNVINAWWPLVFYPATDAPWFTKGTWAMIGTAIATLMITAVVWYLQRREQRMRDVEEMTRRRSYGPGSGGLKRNGEEEGGREEEEEKKADVVGGDEGVRGSWEDQKSVDEVRTGGL